MTTELPKLPNTDVVQCFIDQDAVTPEHATHPKDDYVVTLRVNNMQINGFNLKSIRSKDLTPKMSLLEV